MNITKFIRFMVVLLLLLAGMASPGYGQGGYNLMAVGANGFGQLGDGDGTTIDRSTPVQIDTGVSQVAAGERHSLYVKTDGNLFSMGRNASGQLGDGTTTNHNTPVQIATDISQVAAGGYHSLFLQVSYQRKAMPWILLLLMNE